MIARMSVPSSRRSDLQPQAFIFYGSEEGFPRVLLTKDSRVVSLAECHALIASSQTVSIIQATVVTPERGPMTYVVGYAQVRDNRWVTVLGSSADPADAASLTGLIRSISIAKAR
jgi:hypothetical protein